MLLVTCTGDVFHLKYATCVSFYLNCLMLYAIGVGFSRVGYKNCCFVHVSLVPSLGSPGEQKTKPTQHSVKQMRALGEIDSHINLFIVLVYLVRNTFFHSISFSYCTYYISLELFCCIDIASLSYGLYALLMPALLGFVIHLLAILCATSLVRNYCCSPS